jgi:hypothetical protein
LVNHLAQQAVIRPYQILDLDDKLGSHPMNPAQNEGRPETASARRRHIQWRLGRDKRLQALPQSPRNGPDDWKTVRAALCWFEDAAQV